MYLVWAPALAIVAILSACGGQATKDKEDAALDPVGKWVAVATEGAPTARYDHTATWTGSQLIVWGGTSVSAIKTDTGKTVAIDLATGAAFDPTANAWTAMAERTQVRDHTAVWTGTELIVWGGGNAAYGGDSYDVKAGAWSNVELEGRAPDSFSTKRADHVAVWTGADVIVWGGASSTAALTDGALYNPETEAFRAMSEAGVPAGRENAYATFTGSKMIVWGGHAAVTKNLVSGGVYDPATDTWEAIPEPLGIVGIQDYSVVWTGKELIVWGGRSVAFDATDTGWRYDLAAKTWSSVSTQGAPSPRAFHAAAWTGGKMLVWSGSGHLGTDFKSDGGIYDPETDTWQPMATLAAPEPRMQASAVWTGDRMIVWGGSKDANVEPVGTGGMFTLE